MAEPDEKRTRTGEPGGKLTHGGGQGNLGASSPTGEDKGTWGQAHPWGRTGEPGDKLTHGGGQGNLGQAHPRGRGEKKKKNACSGLLHPVLFSGTSTQKMPENYQEKACLASSPLARSASAT